MSIEPIEAIGPATRSDNPYEAYLQYQEFLDNLEFGIANNANVQYSNGSEDNKGLTVNSDEMSN